MLQTMQNNLKDTFNLNIKNNFNILTELFILDKENNNENTNILMNNYETFVSLHSEYLTSIEYKQIYQEFQ
jgi:hypothetical protein